MKISRPKTAAPGTAGLVYSFSNNACALEIIVYRMYLIVVTLTTNTTFKRGILFLPATKNLPILLPESGLVRPIADRK